LLVLSLAGCDKVREIEMMKLASNEKALLLHGAAQSHRNEEER
jgi:hypothetical protein